MSTKTKTTMYQGREVEYIDCTPTWEAILSQHLMCYENFVEQLFKSKKPLPQVTNSLLEIKKELNRMAQIADLYNVLVKGPITVIYEDNQDGITTTERTHFTGDDAKKDALAYCKMLEEQGCKFFQMCAILAQNDQG